MRDVAHVHNGNAVQTNVVHVDGNRSVLLSVFKNGATSTLDIVSGIKKMLQVIKLRCRPNSTSSRSAISRYRARLDTGRDPRGRDRRGAHELDDPAVPRQLALDADRDTSIPLAVLGAIGTLSAIGETLNIMTLGGLALAVGILVDEATVTIESINYHLEQGKRVEHAILDGGLADRHPSFVSLLCICIVFIPMFFLSGVARFLFVPMAESVIFAMVFSFLLSRTLVPTMAKYLLRMHVARVGGPNAKRRSQESAGALSTRIRGRA